MLTWLYIGASDVIGKNEASAFGNFSKQRMFSSYKRTPSDSRKQRVIDFFETSTMDSVNRLSIPVLDSDILFIRLMCHPYVEAGIKQKRSGSSKFLTDGYIASYQSSSTPSLRRSFT